MEWMLQVVDELDDAVGSLALLWVGVRRGFAMALLGIAGAAILSAIAVLGWVPTLICGAAVVSSATLAFMLKSAGNFDARKLPIR